MLVRVTRVIEYVGEEELVKEQINKSLPVDETKASMDGLARRLGCGPVMVTVTFHHTVDADRSLRTGSDLGQLYQMRQDTAQVIGAERTVDAVAGLELELEEMELDVDPVVIGDHLGRELVITLSDWLRRQKELAGRDIVGKVVRVSDSGKALLFRGGLHVGESQHCKRCGLEITNPVSQWCGYGPVCSVYIGIYRPGDLTEAQKLEVIKKVKLETYMEDVWFPLGQITKVMLVDEGKGEGDSGAKEEAEDLPF